MHRLLKRQLRKYLGDNTSIPPEWERLLLAVSETYEHQDADRKLLQRSMDISSEELMESNDKLVQISENQTLVLNKLKDAIRALKISDNNHDLSDEDVLSMAATLREQISMRNRVERLLREREEGLRLIIESAKDYAIYTLDREGYITSWNAGARRITGYATEEVIGRHFSHFYTANDLTLGRPAEMFEQATYAGRCETQGWRVRKDGSLFWADATLTTLRDEDGFIRGFVKITRDITARKQSEEALKQAKEAAETANRAKSEFLANMSHEIRTPMNAVIGMTSLLLDTPLNREQEEFVETVRASGESLLSIINDILDFSKIEAGKLTLECAPFELRTCIEESLDILAPKAMLKGIEILYELDEQTPFMIEGDITRLRQVLVNLVSNAVKFTDQGEVVVSVRSLPEGNTYRHHVAVKDTGIGIPRDRMNRLFKPFSQVDSSNTRKYGGTGLGLAISKRLVRIMSGTIWVESERDQGTTFHFTFDAPMVLATNPNRNLTTSWQHRRILLVGDNDAARRVYAHRLKQLGPTTSTYATGKAALEHLAQFPHYDLAVLDLKDAASEELALAECIRALPDSACLPLVLLTSRNVVGRREKAAHLSHLTFLSKPLKQQQLQDVLHAILEKEEQAQPSRTPSPLDQTLGVQFPLRILLAEDNIINQRVALQLLERLGYRADAVANGIEVIEALERQSYDLVFMDVQMPEMDGLEATQHIRHRFSSDQQPYIVAITASAMQEDREACLRAGMDDYISKPMRVSDLVKSLQSVFVNGTH